MPDPPDRRREPPPTVSGLDETQIDPADLRALRDAVVLRTCDLEASATVTQLRDFELVFPPECLRQVEPGFSALRALALRIVPLPRQIKAQRLALNEPQLKLRRDLPLALKQPVRRPKLRPDDLPPGKQKALFTALYNKYGPQARELEVQAVFAHVPPEAKDALMLESTLNWAAFTLPPGLAVHQARADFYLVVLSGPGNETRKVLFRL